MGTIRNVQFKNFKFDFWQPAGDFFCAEPVEPGDIAVDALV
jgi:hypothetical protein